MIASASRKLLGPLAGATIALASAPVAHATPSASPEGTPTPDAIRQSSPIGEQRRALDYWTPERMEAARPLDRLLNGDSPQPSGSTTPQKAPRGGNTGERWTKDGEVTDTTGKVYLTMGERDFTCSASVITAGNRDTVVTAGHCLQDDSGTWAKNWTFIPGYDAGDSPHGRYTAREKLVAPQWSKRADDSFDFGMAVLNTADGKHVQNETGAQPIAFNRRPTGRTYAFGYPATDDYDGRHLHYCAGNTHPDEGDTTASGMRCDMTQGSSGGPWLSDFDTTTGTGTVTSVVSFKYADNPDIQYGPFLGTQAKKLYDEARTL